MWAGEQLQPRPRVRDSEGAIDSSDRVTNLEGETAGGTGEAAARVCEGPRHPDPGRGCCGNEGSAGSPV